MKTNRSGFLPLKVTSGQAGVTDSNQTLHVEEYECLWSPWHRIRFFNAGKIIKI
jgi:hypothetical protein